MHCFWESGSKPLAGAAPFCCHHLFFSLHSPHYYNAGGSYASISLPDCGVGFLTSSNVSLHNGRSRVCHLENPGSQWVRGMLGCRHSVSTLSGRGYKDTAQLSFLSLRDIIGHCIVPSSLHICDWGGRGHI